MAAVPEAPLARVRKSARWKSRIIEKCRLREAESLPMMAGLPRYHGGFAGLPMDAIYRSAMNRDVPPAAPGEFAPVPIGPLRVWPPVVLAPMAGGSKPPPPAARQRVFLDER